MYRRPPSSEKIGRDLPIFSEGEGTSVHRLQVSALHFWSKTKDIKNKQVRDWLTVFHVNSSGSFFFVIATLNKSNSNQQGKNYLKRKTATLNFFQDICETDQTTSHLSIYIFFFSKTNRPILYVDFSV